MTESTERILCETPTEGKKPVDILLWKYEQVRDAILDALPEQGEGLLFKELPDRVRERLSEECLQKLGSVKWYTTTVKLDLEARGEIHRLPNSKPQRLLRS